MSGAPPVLLNVARPWGEADPLGTARAAVGTGLDGVGFADSPRLFPDCLVETERVLAATEVRLAGPCVLSLGLRHPVTVASGVRTLERHHPGRVLAVVGRGESSVANEVLPVPSLPAYEQSLTELRDLLHGSSEAPAGLSARVLGAASGPRTITATARCLGGVLVDVGIGSDVLERAIQLARRDDRAVRVWLFLRVVVVRTVAEAATAALPVLGSCASRLARSPEWYAVPAALMPQIQRVAAAHDYRRHGTSEARATSSVAGTAADTEADAVVRDRFVLAGDPGDIATRLARLARLRIDGVVLAGALPGVVERLDELAPAVRAGLGVAPGPGAGQ